jgi:hypothetical protein
MNIGAYVGLFITLFFATPLAAETIPSDVCAESTTWTRPSLQMQQIKVWNKPRYKGFGPNDYTWTRNFLLIDDSFSVAVITRFTNLAGLWTEKPLWLQKCFLQQSRPLSEWIEVWSLLHRVKEIRHEAGTYTVVVEPTGKGFQWFFIPRINHRSAVLRFVTPDGTELEKWDESAPPNRVKK